ncbi:MAG: TRAP transporter substrate-binding protein [Moorellales bacterium]
MSKLGIIGKARGVKLTAVLLLLGLLVLAGGCGKQPAATENQPPAQQAPAQQSPVVEMRLAHAFPETHPDGQTLKFWAEEVGKRTNGAVKITVYPAESLIKTQEHFKALIQGTVEIAHLPSTYLSSEAKEFAPLDVAGLFEASKFIEINQAIAPVMEKIMNKYGLHYLFATFPGDTVFYLRQNKEIHRPADIKGLRVRDHGYWIAKTIKAWGGTPTFLPPADVSVAFERGTVDAGYTGWPFVMAYKLYEQAPYVTWMGYQNMWCFVGMRKDLWDKLTPEQQQILTDVGKEAMEMNKKLNDQALEKFKSLVTQAGGKIYYPTPEEKAAFEAALKPLHEEVAQYSGELGQELINALRSVK